MVGVGMRIYDSDQAQPIFPEIVPVLVEETYMRIDRDRFTL
jgi:hypothetical protein